MDFFPMLDGRFFRISKNLVDQFS